MKVVVFGAGGILGQHMMISKPAGVLPTFCKKTDDPNYSGMWHRVDLCNEVETNKLLDNIMPDVVLNLAGENRVDVVEENPDAYYRINVVAPWVTALWCRRNNAHFIQVSTQGVFSGNNPPYSPYDERNPITEYGKQKREAENNLLAMKSGAEKDISIARMTFVLGVRPFPWVGRENPLEQMFEHPEQKQVNDRYFSPAFADDAAKQLWKLVLNPPNKIVHIGEPIKLTRWAIAISTIHDTYRTNAPKIEPVSHEFFPGIAPRPRDTTWAYGSMYDSKYPENILAAYQQWLQRGNQK